MVNRRQSVRRLLILPQIRVSLGDFSDELLFDLSEGGLAVYGRLTALGRRSFPITFRLPGDADPVATRGEIAWMSRNRTGIRFVDFSDAARFHIKHWIATKLPDVPSYAADYKVDWSRRVLQSTRTIREETWRPNYLGKMALLLGILAALLVFALGLSRFHWRSFSKSQPASAGNSAGQRDLTELSGQVLAAQPPASTEPEITKVPPAAAAAAAVSSPTLVQGFVVQVGALKLQRNVDTLSTSLKQNGFPVIVSKSPDDSLYRVMVGPFPDLSSAGRARNALKAHDIEGFVKPWTRE